VISQCWGIHNNNCTEVAEFGSKFCKACGKEHLAAGKRAEIAAMKPQNRRSGVLSENTGKEARKA